MVKHGLQRPALFPAYPEKLETSVFRIAAINRASTAGDAGFDDLPGSQIGGSFYDVGLPGKCREGKRQLSRGSIRLVNGT